MRKFLLYTAIVLTFLAALLALFNFRRDRALILKQQDLLEDQRKDTLDFEGDMKQLQEKCDAATAAAEASKKELSEAKAAQKKAEDALASMGLSSGDKTTEPALQNEESPTPTPTPAENADDKKGSEKKDAPTPTPDTKEKEAKQSHLEGKVLAVNSTWSFVVISLGEQNGISTNREFVIKHGDQVIAKAKVTSVEPSTSVADIVPNKESSKAAVQVGDVVVEAEGIK
jgi:hypothetical protein